MAYCEKRPNGNYRVRWRENGRLEPGPTFTTLEEADRWRQQHLEPALKFEGSSWTALQVLAQDEAQGVRTVTQQCLHHIEHLTGVEDGTIRDYRGMVERVIDPTIGSIPVTLLTRDHVTQWVKSQTGVTPKTVKNRHTLLSAALTSAVRDNLIAKNVAHGIKMPKPTLEEEMCFLTQDEFAQLVRCAEIAHPHWRSLVLFLGATGMRWGEATALQAKHIDLHSGEIRIAQAWKETRGRGHRIGPPKTKMGKRTIPIPTPCTPDLERLLTGLPPDGFVFRNTQGRPVRHAGFHQHVWQPLIHYFAGDTRELHKPARGRTKTIWHATGDGKRPRIHDLRHSYASWAISAGHSLLAVQRVLGHESVTSTSDRYGHLIRADRDAFSDLLQPVEQRPSIPAA